MTTNVINLEAARSIRRRVKLDAATNEAITRLCGLTDEGLEVVNADHVARSVICSRIDDVTHEELHRVVDFILLAVEQECTSRGLEYP